MPERQPTSQLPEPRLLVVLAGAASVGTTTPTALERASLPALSALASSGRTGRLRAVAPHLEADASTAHATLLGVALSEALDPAAVAAESVGATVGAGEQYALIEVLDHTGEPAPALHVGRAVEVIRAQLPWHRVATVRRGNHVLLAGPSRPVLPDVDGLELRMAPSGLVPERPALDHGTLVIATAGSLLIGVARLLGAAVVIVDGTRAGRQDPVPARLRTAAAAALLGGARTVVVESTAPLVARRGHRDDASRERAVAGALAMLDRELVGPLAATASWARASFAVTADVARVSAGQPTAGDVPLIAALGRDEQIAPPHRSAPVAEGVTPPPPYSERGVSDRPIVTSPFTIPPARDPEAPLRFRRDPATGVTLPDAAPTADAGTPPAGLRRRR